MAAPPYMKFFWGDYHKATRHLTRDQHGAYFLLLGEAWRLGGALPDDDAKLAAWSLCSPSEWAVIKPIVMDFFALRRGKWWHDRVKEELASYEATSRKRKEAGKKGGKASNGTDEENRGANAYQKPTKPEPEPEPKIEEAKASIVRSEPDDTFAMAWKAYPALGRTRSKSLAKTKPIWKVAAGAAGGEDRLLAAVRRYVTDDPTHKGECGPPAFDRWLRDGRWEHWLPSSGDDASGPLAGQAFEGPPQIREWAAQRLGEGYARSYVDPSQWDPDGRRLLAANAFANAKLQSDLRPICEQWNFTVAVASANDATGDLLERAAS